MFSAGSSSQGTPLRTTEAPSTMKAKGALYHRPKRTVGMSGVSRLRLPTKVYLSTGVANSLTYRQASCAASLNEIARDGELSCSFCPEQWRWTGGLWVA